MPFIDTSWWDLIKSIVLPVILFLSGYFLNIAIEEYKEKKRLKGIKEYFKTLIRLVYTVAIEQAKLYQNCSTRLLNLNEREITVNKIVGHPKKSLNDINHTDLYKIFINKNNIIESTRNFNNLLANLNYIESSINLVNKHSEEFSQVANQLSKEWYEKGKLLIETLSKILNTRDVTEALDSEDKYLKKIAYVIDYTFTTPKEKQTLTETYQNVITTLFDLCNQKEYVNDPRNKYFLNLIISLQLIYHQYKDLFKRSSSSCLDSANNLLMSANEIERLSSKL